MNPRPNVAALEIMFWNINGITGRKMELADILARHEVDVAAIQETRLREYQNFGLGEYLIYRKDRTNRAV